VLLYNINEQSVTEIVVASTLGYWEINTSNGNKFLRLRDCRVVDLKAYASIFLCVALASRAAHTLLPFIGDVFNA